MPKTRENSYDVLGTPYDQREDMCSAIKQVVADMGRADPSNGFIPKFHGENLMTVVFHCFEMDLPNRIKEVASQAETRFNEFQKRLKADYKKFCGGALKLKELKDKRDEKIEKVSLNSRYYFRAFRTYEIG